MYGERATKLGWQAGESDNSDMRILRPQVLGLVSQAGDMPQLNAEARRLAKLWLADRKSIRPEMIDTVLTAAARHGDEALFNDLLNAAKASKDEKERGQLVAALGSFGSPDLVKRSLRSAARIRFRRSRVSSSALRTAESAVDQRVALAAFVGKLRRLGGQDASHGRCRLRRAATVYRTFTLFIRHGARSTRSFRRSHEDTHRRATEPSPGHRIHGVV